MLHEICLALNPKVIQPFQTYTVTKLTTFNSMERAPGTTLPRRHMATGMLNAGMTALAVALQYHVSKYKSKNSLSAHKGY
jgi:hypothetical protein